MKFGITAKLFCAMLAACAVVVVINGVATRIAFQHGFIGYLNAQGTERIEQLLPRLQAEYTRHGSWEFVRGQPEVWFRLMRPNEVDTHHDEDGLPVPPVSDQSGAVFRFALLDRQGHRVIGNPRVDEEAIRRPIVVDGQTVGWMAMVPFQRVLDGNQRRFIEEQVRRWWAIGIGSVLVAVTLTWLLSRALLRRLRDLATATHRLSAGDYSTRIASGRDDEIGHLAQDFNRMADTLDNIEQNRRAFMADISHELRTPLAVLRAELEAIQDGIRPMTPAALTPLQGEVRQLGKLIDDLYDLALTQSGTLVYRRNVLDVSAVLQATLDGMRGRFADAGLTLMAPPSAGRLTILGDEWRLQQVFANVLENSLRYTDAGGVVAVQAQAKNGQAKIVIEDSTPGVSEDKLGRLFERFYRVEGSRNRASGGSGLGLAISHNIVMAHGGDIRAEASALGGLRIVLTLPLSA